MDKKIAKVELDLKNGKDYRDLIADWLHEIAVDIKKMDTREYIDKPRWTLYQSGDVDNNYNENKQELIPKIINILSYQKSITDQGVNYTGEKDWALNKILELIENQIAGHTYDKKEELSGLTEIK